jgi:alkanesulfonate monooxygenase SsuD/methylene tetrahydromethanopterin reductase-like flavin-dependent oxidoreductase (luciferase family)
MPYLYSPEKLADQTRILREELQALGRDPGAVRVGVHLFAMVSDDALHARRRIVESVGRTYAQDAEAFADRYLLHGTPERVVARLAEYRDAGASLLVLRLAGEEAEREEQTHRLAEVAASLRGA